MIGKKFGMLTVLDKGPRNEKWRSSVWRCLCDCGREKLASRAYLRVSKNPSCGCSTYNPVSAAARKYNTLEDYLRNTKKKRHSDCLLWQGTLTPSGYGSVGTYTPRTKTVPKRSALVHRRVFELANGFMPEVVLHICDTPQCINPAHLRAGTKSDNTRDAAVKGRLYSQQNAERVLFEGTSYSLRELAEHTGTPLPTIYWRLRHGKPPISF